MRGRTGEGRARRDLENHDMKRMLFLYNPTAGKGAAAAHLSGVVDQFTKAGWLTTVYPTQGKKDATRVARELGSYYDRVVCCGGDGTLSETAAGLLELSRPPLLGYIPSGSTNDCGATLRIPRGYKKAAELAAGDSEPLRWDIGTLNQQPFVYVAAFGAFTEVSYDTPQDLKNTFGHLAYIMAGIASIPSITPYHMKVEYDGQVLEDDFFYGMVCNTYSVAGMRNLPTDRVELDDGLFEVILVRKPMSIGEIGAGLQTLLRPGAVEEGSALLSFHASQLKFTSEKPIPWTIDGEYGGSHEVSRVQNHRQALAILSGRKQGA